MTRKPVLTMHRRPTRQLRVYLAGLIVPDADALWLRDQIFRSPLLRYAGPDYADDGLSPEVPEPLKGDESWTLWADPESLERAVETRREQLLRADTVLAWFHSPWYAATVADLVAAVDAGIPVFAGLRLDLLPSGDGEAWRFSRAIRDLAPVLARATRVCAVPTVTDAFSLFERWCRELLGLAVVEGGAAATPHDQHE